MFVFAREATHIFAREAIHVLQNVIKTNLPRVVVREELSKPLGGKDEQTENRLTGDPESLLPRQHHVDHAQVMICVLVADIDRLQTS